MKLVTLLSGGIDSPVAAYMMANVGAEIVLLHMDNGKYGDKKDLEKVKKIAAQLRKISGKEMPLYVANHEMSQTAIKENCENNYQCVMCKRIMQNVAKNFALNNGCSAIVMGDSLGQVASQTLRNIRAEQNALDFPIIRPLIGLDKLEIIDIAKKIGTYELSIEATTGCSAVPLKPITEAKVEMVEKLQRKINFEELTKNSADNAYKV